MSRKTDEELDKITIEVIDMLRPHHLAVFEIRRVLAEVDKLLDYMILREKPKSVE